MEQDLKWVKKHYGEKMMHMCRELFPTILETEGLLPSILVEHFSQCRHLADDIVKEGQIDNFANYIKTKLSNVENKETEEKKKPEKSAVELMKEAGYTLYPECLNEAEVQAFKKYYKPNEALCTFKGERVDICRVWFAVKDNVDKIRREDFDNPERQDEYGTSVISIQFSKAGNRLSIKNRYNHTVPNPDNTFNNNLDNIIPGLTDAFEVDYGVRDRQNRNSEFSLSKYIDVDGKFYPYNFESNNIYYCENNIVIDLFKVKTLPSHLKLLECFVVDSKNNTIEKYMPDNGKNFQHEDCFDETIGKIKSMKYEKDGLYVICENGDKVFIGFDDRNRITAYENENLQEIGDMFLCRSENLKNMHIPNVKTCGEYFMYQNRDLKELYMPQLEACGVDFLSNNRVLEKLDLPKLRNCGDGFMLFNAEVKELSLPSLEKCGTGFMGINDKLEYLNFPKLKECGNDFCHMANSITAINIPKLEVCGDDFLLDCDVREIDMPYLIKCGDNFFAYNRCIEKVNLPNLSECGTGFLWRANGIEELELPNLQRYDCSFMYFNRSIKRLSLPNLKYSYSFGDILGSNQVLEELDIPSQFKTTPQFERLVNLTKQNKKKAKSSTKTPRKIMEYIESNASSTKETSSQGVLVQGGVVTPESNSRLEVDAHNADISLEDSNPNNAQQNNRRRRVFGYLHRIFGLDNRKDDDKEM